MLKAFASNPEDDATIAVIGAAAAGNDPTAFARGRVRYAMRTNAPFRRAAHIRIMEVALRS